MKLDFSICTRGTRIFSSKIHETVKVVLQKLNWQKNTGNHFTVRDIGTESWWGRSLHCPTTAYVFNLMLLYRWAGRAMETQGNEPSCVIIIINHTKKKSLFDNKNKMKVLSRDSFPHLHKFIHSALTVHGNVPSNKETENICNVI